MLLKLFSALGSVALGASGVWGFLTIATPTLPPQPAPAKIQLAPPVQPTIRPIAMAMPWPPATPVAQPAPAPGPAAQPVPVMQALPQVPAIQATAEPASPPDGAALLQVAASAPSDGEAGDTAIEADVQQPAPEVRAPVGVARQRSVGRQVRVPRCTRNKSYNAATHSYRGFDGVVHPCNR